jgi:hypothetical protein
MAGLTGLDRKSIDKVEAIAKPRRFFHWDLEFPECFFGLRPGTQRQIEHKLPAEAGFDAVVGNPPYAGHKGDFDAKPLTLFFEVCRNYPNPATAFCEKAITVLTLSGRYGLILPKSIQYVEAWSDARTLLAKANTLDRLVDVSQAFEDVLLEQTICVGQKANSSESYLAAVAGAKAVGNHNVIPLTVLNDFGCLPAVLEQGSLDLLQFIASLGAKLGGISYTCQALGYQAKINLPAGGERLPIYRGRHVRPMRIDDTGDWIDRNYLTKSASTEFTDKVSAMLEPKVVSQNIVAHVTQPKPRVWIISSPDLKGIVCLNTISTTYIRDPRFPVPFIAAVLNSSLASWFFYEFVFCRAVRTMHFDDYYAGKLPVPVPTKATVTACETLVSDCQTPLSRSERQAAVDKIVFKAYQLSPEMQDFVHRYCYGTNDLSVLDGTSEPATEEATDA